MQNSDNYLKNGHPEDGQSVTGCRRAIQHAHNITTRASTPCHNGCIRRRLALCVLCPLNILPVQADDADGTSSAGELRGWLVRQDAGETDNAELHEASVECVFHCNGK